MRFLGRVAALASLALLAACATKPVPSPEAPAPPPAVARTPPPPVPSPPVSAPNARAAGIKAETPKVLGPEEAGRALEAFRTSCPALLTRQDQSQLTQPGDWRAVCAEAAALASEYAPGFFFYRFDWTRVADGKAFATGYYEPEIEGSPVQLPGYVPIYRVPSDLVRCTKPDGTSGRGRVDQAGTCVLYYTRAEIDDGAIAGKGLELAWAKDAVDLFVMEIQGSGRIRMPDGTVMRVGYAGQNGRDYVAVGRLLRQRGILPPGGCQHASDQGLDSRKSGPGARIDARESSYVFFKELTGPGPLGALNVAVSPKATVAADPNFVPLGAPVFLKMDRPEASGLWVAQDTGGAIKGSNRFDTFWGAGPEAVAIAGGMSASGEALILLPKGSVETCSA